MLVLTRKQNEKIQIGDGITITVLKLKGKAVRLGIEAPQSVNVLRGELVFDLDVDGAEQLASSESEETPTGKRKSSSHPPRSYTGESWPVERPGTSAERQEIGV